MPPSIKSKKRFLPSIILGEAYPAFLRGKDELERAAIKIAAEGFFRRIELPFVEDESFPASIRAICQQGGLSLTLWASEILARENLNLSSGDETLRRKSVARVRRLVELAIVSGADCVGILSGPDPGETQRAKGLQQLLRSLIELGQCAKNAVIAIEPLDRGAHKNGLLGPTMEAIELVRMVRKETDRVFLSWDSGHAVLNNEDPVESFSASSSLAYQMHLSNPVNDRSSPFFGDYHYPIWRPGAGTEAQFRKILQAAADCPLRNDAISVAVEVRTQDEASPTQTIVHCQGILQNLLTEPNS